MTSEWQLLFRTGLGFSIPWKKWMPSSQMPSDISTSFHVSFLIANTVCSSHPTPLVLLLFSPSLIATFRSGTCLPLSPCGNQKREFPLNNFSTDSFPNARINSLFIPNSVCQAYYVLAIRITCHSIIERRLEQVSDRIWVVDVSGTRLYSRIDQWKK